MQQELAVQEQAHTLVALEARSLGLVAVRIAARGQAVDTAAQVRRWVGTVEQAQLLADH